MLRYRLLWVTTVAVPLLLLLLQSLTEARMMNIWRHVPASYSKVTGAKKTTQEEPPIPPGASPILYCSSLCSHRAWCGLWCHNSSNCIVSNLIVLPTYLETNLADVVPCHTRRSKDLATNAIITAGEEDPPLASRPKENLVDGYYSYIMGDIYESPPPADKKWFLLDFSQPVPFTHVVLHAQNNDRANIQFVDVEVRVGNVTVTPPSGFSAYDLFGFFPGGAYEGQVVDMVSANPVYARFVSVQMLMDNLRPFQVAHVEVY